MGTTCTARFRTSARRERPSALRTRRDTLVPPGRGIILLPGFFIVDTDRFIPEPNNYAALDRLDLGGETTGVMLLASSPSPRSRGRMLRVMRDRVAGRMIMQLIRNMYISPENTEMFTKKKLNMRHLLHTSNNKVYRNIKDVRSSP